MSTVLWLLALQGALGGFDTAYYHEWRARLVAHVPDTRVELYLHALRDFVYALVFAFSTETSSLAAFGPHPDGGVRFYGMSNQVETLLLVPAAMALVEVKSLLDRLRKKIIR